ncbi:MAG: VIT domain-containing protein [Candidatus Hodarchaeales archaeon]
MNAKRKIVLVFCFFGIINLLIMNCVSITADDGSGFMVMIHPDDTVEIPEIRVHNVSVSILKNYAITKVYEEFVNPHDEPMAGTFYFPIPENSLISNFSLIINGTAYYAECMEVEKAEAEFEKAKEEGREAAIMKYVGANMFSYSVSMSANSTLGVGIEYEQLLELKYGKYTYKYAMDLSGNDLPITIDSVNLDFDLDGGNQRITSLNTDFQGIIEQSISDYRKELVYHGEQLIPSTDFAVDYQLEIGGSSGNLMTYTKGDERYFLYSLAPDLEDLGTEVYLGKNIIFVVDVSGSMSGESISQVKTALSSIINSLNPLDKFNILPYESEVTMYKTEMVTANYDNQMQALSFISGLAATGGTNINDALVTSLGQFKENLPGLNLIVFMTDGQPTAGITDTESIVSNVKTSNENSATIYSFGFGVNLNFDLLQQVSYYTGGEAYQIDPDQEDIQIELEDFYKTVEDPLMSQISLKFTSSDANIQDTIPISSSDATSLETLFDGSEKLITGKMSTEATTLSIEISALVGDLRNFIVKDTFNLVDTESTNFVERIHASRKIDSLLDIITFISNDELLNATIDEIVTIAMKYGFATPYTALLIDPSKLPLVEGEEMIDYSPQQTFMATTNTQDKAYPPGGIMASAPGFGLLELSLGVLMVIVIYKRKRGE